MDFDDVIETPAEWMQIRGDHSEIVVTSRIRLARNVRGRPFPGWARKGDNVDSLERIFPQVCGLPEFERSFAQELSNLTAIQKQVLVERHLISREHAARGNGSAAVMNPSQTVSIMINEEDHLRMQAILPGLALTKAYETIDSIDTSLEQDLDFAFDYKLGYLTACPTNLGTGLRASAMLHLPALVLNDQQVNQVVQAVNKIGLAVRGLYGEGTEALANLFQVSNQTTLGDGETEIISRLQRVIEQIINHEQNARAKLLLEKPAMLYDQIGRAFGTLRYAHQMASKEALNHLSMIRLGADLGFFPSEHRTSID
ncbi:MAG: ATP--guanido phosphotransferase, partial [Verrucomicrobiota bacterium]